jgi:hypothetical protein
VRRLLVKASLVPSSLSLVSLMKEALSYSETSVLTRVTRRNIPEDGILNVLFNLFNSGEFACLYRGSNIVGMSPDCWKFSVLRIDPCNGQ